MSSETRSPHFARAGTATVYRDVHLPRIFAPWARVLVEVVPTRPGDAVLDVATGPGTVAREAAALAGASGRVVGIDLSPAMLGVARSFAAAPDAAPIEYIEAPASAIPLRDASFDVAYCQQGLQHMSDPLAALGEMRRLLKAGGRLGIATWIQSPFGIFREIVARMNLPSDGPQPSRFGVDADELRSLLQQAGFENVQVVRRELISTLEGGTSEAVDVVAGSSGAAMLERLTAEQKQAVRDEMERALQKMQKDGVVHLPSVTNIASGGVSL